MWQLEEWGIYFVLAGDSFVGNCLTSGLCPSRWMSQTCSRHVTVPKGSEAAGAGQKPRDAASQPWGRAPRHLLQECNEGHWQDNPRRLGLFYQLVFNLTARGGSGRVGVCVERENEHESNTEKMLSERQRGAPECSTETQRETDRQRKRKKDGERQRQNSKTGTMSWHRSEGT